MLYYEKYEWEVKKFKIYATLCRFKKYYIQKGKFYKKKA